MNCFDFVVDTILPDGYTIGPILELDHQAPTFSLMATEVSLWTDNVLDVFVAPICPGHPQD